MRDRSFKAFVQAVQDSCEGHARRKNYCAGGVDDGNQLLTFLAQYGLHEPHAIGEIIYKAVEMMKAPGPTKKILCEKIAGWAWTIWKELPEEK